MVRAALTLLILGAVMLVGAGITTGIGADVTANIQATQTVGSVAWAATGNSTSGIGNLATQLPNVGTVLGAAAILAIIFGVLFSVVGGKSARGE